MYQSFLFKVKRALVIGGYLHNSIQRETRGICKLAYSVDAPGLLAVEAIERSRLFKRMLAERGMKKKALLPS